MARSLQSQRQFNSGSLSYKLYGRGDLAQYNKGLKTAENIICTPQGPFRRRNGTQYLAEIADSTKEARLIPFQVSSTQSVVCEFGNLTIRFFSDKGQIKDGATPYEIASTYTSSQLDSINYVQYNNELYLTHPDVPPKILTRLGAVDWTLEDAKFFPPPTTESGFKPQTTVTPGAVSGAGVTFTAANSVFLAKDVGRQIVDLVNGGRASIVSFSSGTQVTCDIVDNFDSTDAIQINNWKLDLSPINTITPDKTKTGDIATITCTGNTFRSEDVGRFILLNDGVAEIITFTNATSIDAVIWKSLASTDATTDWSIEDDAWSASRGYPRAVALFDQRLFFGGTAAQPSTVWGSETAIFDGFGVGSGDSDGLSLTIASSKFNEISWLEGARDLIVGTSSSELSINGGNAVLTPSSAQQRPRTFQGSDVQKPVSAGSELLFIQATGKKIRNMIYSFDSDGYVSQDLTLFSDHLTEDGIKELSYAQEPDSIIYAVTNTGDLLAGTYSREQEIMAWTKLTTNGNFERVAVIRENDEDVVYVICKRTINGSEVRYVEVFDSGDGTSNGDSFSDCFLTYTGTSTTTITGLDHLEGETVTIRADGATQANKTVSSGSIELDYAAETVVVGLDFTTTVETLEKEIPAGGGSFQGQATRWVSPIVRIYNSSIPDVSGQSKPARTSLMSMDTKETLYTGDVKYSSVDTPTLSITFSGPQPLFVTAIFGYMEAGY